LRTQVTENLQEGFAFFVGPVEHRS
jgi:hypothetical protein